LEKANREEAKVAQQGQSGDAYASVAPVTCLAKPQIAKDFMGNETAETLRPRKGSSS
jgi:hypothetical protein